MIVCFSDRAWDEYLFWQENDKSILKRINALIKDIKRNSSDKNGLGKPEMLKSNLAGYYSRRINHEHRLVYKILDEFIVIAQCRFHY